jgi:hypothetical protein
MGFVTSKNAPRSVSSVGHRFTGLPVLCFCMYRARSAERENADLFGDPSCSGLPIQVLAMNRCRRPCRVFRIDGPSLSWSSPGLQGLAWDPHHPMQIPSPGTQP